MKNFFFFVLGLGIIIGSIFLFLNKPVPKEYSSRIIKINDTSIKVDIADSPEERRQGLSGRMSLANNTGMLFIFETPGQHGFWMKDMNFSIDIVWIDENLQIVGIDKNIAPETFPNIFYPNQLVKYVLEIPAGYSDAHRIGLGAVIQ